MCPFRTADVASCSSATRVGAAGVPGTGVEVSVGAAVAVGDTTGDGVCVGAARCVATTIVAMSCGEALGAAAAVQAVIVPSSHNAGRSTYVGRMIRSSREATGGDLPAPLFELQFEVLAFAPLLQAVDLDVAEQRGLLHLDAVSLDEFEQRQERDDHLKPRGLVTD